MWKKSYWLLTPARGSACQWLQTAVRIQPITVCLRPISTWNLTQLSQSLQVLLGAIAPWNCRSAVRAPGSSAALRISSKPASKFVSFPFLFLIEFVDMFFLKSLEVLLSDVWLYSISINWKKATIWLIFKLNNFRTYWKMVYCIGK